MIFATAFCASPPIQQTAKPSSSRPFPRCTAINVASEQSSDDSKFSAWAAANKIDMSRLTLRTYHDDSNTAKAFRGMTATTPLKKGDQLISVAQRATLQVNSLDRRRSPIPSEICTETWSKLPWFARLGLLILKAKKEPENELHDWIDRLPSSFQMPLHWSEKELAELQSRRMTKLVHDQRKSYKKWFDEINGNTENSMTLSYSEFIWAIECVRSRAFSGPLEVAPFEERLRLFLFISACTLGLPSAHLLAWENALNGGLTALFALAMYDFILPKVLRVIQGVELRRFAMTPGIDFLNHSSDVTGTAEVSYEYFAGKFIVQSGQDYNVDDQVYISYGAQSNDSFLQYYGFVEQKNPFDTYSFTSDVEKAMGVQEGTLIARKSSGFDDSTIDAVAKLFNGNKQSASTALCELCDAELAAMATTLQQDIELLNTQAVIEDPRRLLAIRYRIEKKKLLQSLCSSA